MFKYKINKTINLGIVKDYNNFIDEEKVIVFDKIIEIGKSENKNIDRTKLELLKNIFTDIENYFNNFFLYEKYHRFGFETMFYYMERKKIAQKNSEDVVNRKIFEKYKDLFQNLQKNIYFLGEYSNFPQENYERLSKLFKTIRYLKYDLDKLVIFIKNYNYFGNIENKKQALEKLKNESENLEKFSSIILNYYSKKSGKGEQIFKIALNPAILNMNTEVNKEYVGSYLAELEENVKELNKKNDKNKEIKKLFLDYVDSYMNYILYEEQFFDKNKNRNWYKHCEEIYNEISQLRGKLRDEKDLPPYKEYICDFLGKNSIEKSDEIYFNSNIKNKLLNQECEIKICKKKVEEIFLGDDKLSFDDYTFIQMNTLKYELLWKKAKLKEKREKYERISKYITFIKGEINTRLKKGTKYEILYLYHEKNQKQLKISLKKIKNG